jgi:hypothetical protein
MVASRLSHRYRTTVVSWSAFRPDVYLSLCRVLAITRSRPRLLILPVNLRCFSPQWDRNPEFDFAREIAAIETFRRHPEHGVPRLTPTKDLPRSYWKWREFRRTPVRYPVPAPERVAGFLEAIASRPADARTAEARWRQIFVFHYLHPVAEEHRQLRFLEETLRQLGELRVPVLAYLTPVNHEAGVRLLGDAFVSQVSATVATVLRRMADVAAAVGALPGAPRPTVADWGFLLGEDCFFHRNEPTEHLNERGRRRLADALAGLALRA